MISGIPVLPVRSSPRTLGDEFVSRQAFEGLSDRFSPSLDVILDPLLSVSGVLGDILEHPPVELVRIHLSDVDES